MRPKTILLVDDHAAVRSGLRLLLENDGFQVLEAADSAQVYSSLNERTVDLILLDTQLEQEDGVELATALRGHHPHLPIAMLSMHSDMTRVRRAVRAGANGYLLKQAAAEEVVAATRLLLFGVFIWIRAWPRPFSNPHRKIARIRAASVNACCSNPCGTT